MNPTPVVLYGESVRLEPLDPSHADQLLEAAQDDVIWQFMPIPRPATRADIVILIEKAWSAAAAGAEMPFAIIDAQTDRAVGSTRFLEIRRIDRGLEIGWTWLGTSAQRTPINTECKYLLLRHAFEDLGAIRVQLNTDGRNTRSLASIERIGGAKEGVLRKHRKMWDGVVRDSVYFSVLDTEWPEVKVRLERLLKQ
ncbi:MAG: GNAT family protein [Gemmatimonadota bacterium]